MIGVEPSPGEEGEMECGGLSLGVSGFSIVMCDVCVSVWVWVWVGGWVRVRVYNACLCVCPWLQVCG